MITVADILSRYDGPIAVLASQVRYFVLSELKDILEIPDQSISLIGYGYGTGYKDLICTIMLSKKNVKIGFYKGTELPDPQKLLTGTGKVHRYIEINSEKDINNPAVKKLMKAALKAYKERTT
jgi:hypothetical protein